MNPIKIAVAALVIFLTGFLAGQLVSTPAKDFDVKLEIEEKK